MSAVSLPPRDYPADYEPTAASHSGEPEWTRIGAGVALLAGSLMLLSGKRRPGLVVTAAGTALVLLNEQETVRAWWKAVPGYLNSAQRLIDEAQHTLDDLAAKRDKLMALFPKQV